MDEKLIYIDPEVGLVRADEETIKNSFKAIVTEAYGDVFLDDNYPDGIIINGLTKDVNDAFDAIETIYNMLDINNAEGTILDTLGNIRNEHRKKATESYLYVNITVPETCVYPRSSMTLKDENNNSWTLDEDLTITVTAPATSGTGLGVFKSYNTGVLKEPTTLTITAYPETVPVAKENVILSIYKFDSGENKESDIAFRNRMNNYTVFNSITLKENLTAQLFNLSYIKDVKIYYNNSTLNLITKGNLMTVPSGKMLVMIKSSSNFDIQTERKQEVFDTIENYKGLGTLCWLPELDDISVAINDSTFSTAVSDTEGTYIFEYDGTNWNLNSSQVNLTTYGITLTGTPFDNDILTVTLIIESGTPSTTHNYTTVGKGYISQSGDPLIADGISQFLVPDTQEVEGVSLRYIKSPNFDATLSDLTDPDSDPISVVNIKQMIKYYVNNKGIGVNITIGDLISYLYTNTNEIYVVSLDITGATNGTLVNNDKVLYINISNITLTEQS